MKQPYYIYISIYLYIYTVKMKVRMPPRIPNIPPPQLECGTRTAKNHSVRMPPHPGFKFFVVFGKLFAQIPHLKCLHTMSIIKCWNAVRMLPLKLFFTSISAIRTLPTWNCFASISAVRMFPPWNGFLPALHQLERFPLEVAFTQAFQQLECFPLEIAFYRQFIT